MLNSKELAISKVVILPPDRQKEEADEEYCREIWGINKVKLQGDSPSGCRTYVVPNVSRIGFIAVSTGRTVPRREPAP